MQSFFFLITENKVFWEKTDFFSELKQREVKDSDYENYFYLYKNLRCEMSAT